MGRPADAPLVLPLDEDLVAVLGAQVRRWRAWLNDLLPDTPTGLTSDDPFELWAQDLAADPEDPDLPDDPATRRLFPNPYPHDADAASDYRRHTTREQRDRKLGDAEVVLAALTAASADPVGEVIVPAEEVGSWLRTLNALRLRLSVVLGVTDAESLTDLERLPATDRRRTVYAVYQLLGELQQAIVMTVSDVSPLQRIRELLDLRSALHDDD